MSEIKNGTVRRLEDPENGIRPHYYVRLAEPAAEPWHIAWCDGDQQLSGWQSDADMEGCAEVGYLPVVECMQRVFHLQPDDVVLIGNVHGGQESIRAFVDWAQAEWPDRKVVCFGDSIDVQLLNLTSGSVTPERGEQQ